MLLLFDRFLYEAPQYLPHGTCHSYPSVYAKRVALYESCVVLSRESAGTGLLWNFLK